MREPATKTLIAASTAALLGFAGVLFAATPGGEKGVGRIYAVLESLGITSGGTYVASSSFSSGSASEPAIEFNSTGTGFYHSGAGNGEIFTTFGGDASNGYHRFRESGALWIYNSNNAAQFINVQHDGSDAIINTPAGDLELAGASGSIVEFQSDTGWVNGGGISGIRSDTLTITDGASGTGRIVGNVVQAHAHGYAQPSGTSTTTPYLAGSWFGATVADSTSDTGYTAGEGRFFQQNTTAATNGTSTLLSAGTTVHANFLSVDPTIRHRFSLETTTDVRFATGLSDANANAGITGDDPAESMLALRYSTSAGEDSFMFVVDDGTTQTVVDTEVPIDTDVHTFEVRWTSTTDCWLVLYDVNGVEEAAEQFTTNLPAEADEMRPFISTRTLTTSSATHQIYTLWVGLDP